MMVTQTQQARVSHNPDVQGVTDYDKIKYHGSLNAYKVVKAFHEGALLNGGFSKAVLGDDGGNDTNDTFLVRLNTSTNLVEILRNGTLLTTVTNATSKVIGVFMLAGNDAFTTQGNFLNPLYVHGGRGNDVINGGGGDDTVFGGLGADTINTGVGDDTVYGQAGNDVLTGGNGNDSLFGDAGADIFHAADGYYDYLAGGSDSDDGTDRDAIDSWIP